MTNLWQDLRYGARMLLNKPGFTLIAVLTMALGIGANTAIFSVVNAVLLRALPYPQPDRLLVLTEKTRQGRIGIAYPNYKDWREGAQSFTEMAGYRGALLNLTGVDKPVRLRGRMVNWNFFRMLGVRPQIGRGFVEDDDKEGAAPVTLLSHALWRDRFGGDAEISGRAISLNGTSFTVIGVLPAGFEFFSPGNDLFIPLGANLSGADQGRGNHSGLNALARLKEGVSIEQAGAEMDTIAAQLERSYPDTNSGIGALTYKLLDRYTSDVSLTLWVLLITVGFVLLIACVNVANLLLTRAAERHKEIAIRNALGAGRWRIVRQLLSESMLLAVLSGLSGLALGAGMLKGLMKLTPDGIARLSQTRLDVNVLFFTLGVSLFTGLMFGLMPALQAAKTDLQMALKEGGRTGAGVMRERMRKGLLVAEVALSLALLVGAGLMTRTVYRLTQVDPGFAAENLLTMQFSLPRTAYTEPRLKSFYQESVSRIESIPGVRAAALALSLPIDGSNWNSVFIAEDLPVPPRADLPSSAFIPVSANYFKTMGIRLLKGRVFSEADTSDKPAVTVINEKLASRLWPGANPIGKRLKQGWPEDKTPWREVVGVVADVKLNGVDRDTPLQTYLPLAQEPSNFLGLVVRASGEPINLAATVENTIHTIDKDLPVFNVLTMDQLLNDAIARQRLTMALLSGFAALALLLAAVGIYGVISYSVTLRSREIGIRMALGAQRGDVLRLIVGQGLRLTSIGVGLGWLSAFALSRWMESLLFGVRATDPLTFTVIPVILTAVALLACWIPARRATKVDPMIALRCE